MKSRKKLLGGLLGSGAGLAILATLFFLWMGPNRQVRQALALRDQFAESDDLSRAARNSLKTELMRKVDEMDRDVRRKLQEELREQRREFTRRNMEKYQHAAYADKPAVLDEALDHMVRMRGADSAIGRYRGRRGYRPRRPRNDGANNGQGQTGRDAAGDAGQRRSPREGNGGVAERNRSREGGEDGRQRNRDRDDRGQQLTDEQREMLAQYYTALRERAEERGIDMRRRRWR